jgi:hypothetical protein
MAAAFAFVSMVAAGTARAQNSCDVEITAPAIEGSGDDRHIFGSATRSGCTTSARMTLRLRQRRPFWFDRNLKTIERTGTNFTAGVNYDCRGSGQMRVFAEAIVSARKCKSPDISATFCR